MGTGRLAVVQARAGARLVAAVGVSVAGLLPVLGFIPFGFQHYSTVADRYMYTAMLGPALALAWGLAQLAQTSMLAVGCVVILGILGIRECMADALLARYHCNLVRTCPYRPSRQRIGPQ